jgi:hypothetical protein
MEIKMAVAKKKVGRPPKEKSFIEQIRLDPKKYAEIQKKHNENVKQKSIDMQLSQYDRRIAKLERILEDAVNAGRDLHKKIETLSSVRQTGWQSHHGNVCPVFEETHVEVLLRSGEKNGPHPAFKYMWRECGAGTIVAYKVV